LFLYESGLIHKGKLVVDLVAAKLNEANLIDANLRRANLRGAQGVTDEQLAEAGDLTGATMPHGQKYEDWLKSKGREEGGKNDGSS
jgi:hypothetical protein